MQCGLTGAYLMQNLDHPESAKDHIGDDSPDFDSPLQQTSWSKIKKIVKSMKEKIIKDKKEIDKNEISHSNSKNEFIEAFKEKVDHSSGVDITKLLEIKNLTVEEIAALMKTGNADGNYQIAEYLYNESIYSRHTFDCGRLSDNIPKLDVETKSEMVKNTKPYNLTPEDQNHVTNFFNLLLKNNLVEVAPPHQSFGAPIFTVKTRNDGTGLPRIIADMRNANLSIKQSKAATLPDYKQLLNKMITKSKYVSSFDLKKCYYSIPLSERAKETGLFNVILPQGVYRFNTAITGLNCVPAFIVQTFLKYLHLDENGKFSYIKDIIVFIDDIIIFSDGNLEDHVCKVKNVLKRLKKIGVKVSPEKANTCIDIDNGEIELLGYKIKNRKFCIPYKKIKTITEMTYPDSLKKLQVFLGKLNYYRNIFSLKIHEALNKLYKKLSPFTFDDELKKNFDIIKEKLNTEIQSIDTVKSNSVNILFSDSSFYSTGGVLLNLNMNEACKDLVHKIKSFEFTPENKKKFLKEGEDLQILTCKDNFVETLFETAKILNYKTQITNDIQAFMNLAFIYCQLTDFEGFFPIRENETEKMALKRLEDNLFCKSYTEIDKKYMEEKLDEFTYLLAGFANLLDVRIHMFNNTHNLGLNVGSQLSEILIMYNCEENLYYGIKVIK